MEDEKNSLLCADCPLMVFSDQFAIRPVNLLDVVEAVLLLSFECAVSLVVHIDIDHAIALFKLAGCEADQVNEAPDSIAEKIDAFLTPQLPSSL